MPADEAADHTSPALVGYACLERYRPTPLLTPILPPTHSSSRTCEAPRGRWQPQTPGRAIATKRTSGRTWTRVMPTGEWGWVITLVTEVRLEFYFTTCHSKPIHTLTHASAQPDPRSDSDEDGGMGAGGGGGGGGSGGGGGLSAGPSRGQYRTQAQVFFEDL